MLIQCIGVVAHIAGNYLFLNVLGYQIVGTGLAGVLTNFIVLICLYFYTKMYFPESKSYVIDSKMLLDYLKLGYPCTFMNVMEWSAYSLMSF